MLIQRAKNFSHSLEIMETLNIIENQSDFLAFIKDQAMENGNLSIRGAARCCGVQETSLIRGAAFNSVILEQTLTEQGFEAPALVATGFPPQAVWLCIEYFAFLSKAKAPMAKQLARTFGSFGILATLKNLKKQEVTSEVPRQLPPKRDYIEHLDAVERISKVANPIVRSYLEQAQMEELSSQLSLSAEKDDELVICTVLAKEMGFTLKPGQDSQLGKWVKRNHEPKGQAQHGRYPVHVYARSEIQDTVAAFFR